MLIRSHHRTHATGIAGKFVTFAGAMVLCGLSASLSAQPVPKDHPNKRIRIIVHPSVPARTVKELIALARQRPGKINYTYFGIGNITYIAAELMKSMTGVNIVASTPEEFARFVAQDVAFMLDLARKIETSAK